MVRIGVVLIVAGLGCAACGHVDMPFDDAMLAAAKAQLEPGKAEIKGTAFLRKPNGGFATAGGEWVYLIPVTPYAEARFRALYGGSRARQAAPALFAVAGDPRYREAMRKTKARKDGGFVFEGVKPGKYYIATTITWANEYAMFDSHGGIVYDEVDVKPSDETVEAIVSGK